MTPRVGFIINGRVPSLGGLMRGMNPAGFLLGWDDAASPMSEMRFRWIARELASKATYGLYRPGQHHDAVVFVKSMTDECRKLAEYLRGKGTSVIFDANVDYYTRGAPGSMPRDLMPTARQRDQAAAMTRLADLVIASSRHLAGICTAFNALTRWIPDNVNPSLIPKTVPDGNTGGILNLWWSGMAQKVIDLLALEHILPLFGNRIRLNIVTGDLCAAMAGMHRGHSDRLRVFLDTVPHSVIPYRSVASLMELYGAAPGVIISPRFLDNPYNLSHSEWKITLGMACGLPAITSPQPSYLDVRERCGHPSALTICGSDEEWFEALESAIVLPGSSDASNAARDVVMNHYSTPVVSASHLNAILSLPGRN